MAMLPWSRSLESSFPVRWCHMGVATIVLVFLRPVGLSMTMTLGVSHSSLAKAFRPLSARIGAHPRKARIFPSSSRRSQKSSTSSIFFNNNSSPPNKALPTVMMRLEPIFYIDLRRLASDCCLIVDDYKRKLSPTRREMSHLLQAI